MSLTFNPNLAISESPSSSSLPSGHIAFSHLEILNIMKSDSKELLRSVNAQRSSLGLPAVNIQLIPVNGSVYARLDPTDPRGAGFTPFDNSGRVFINADNPGLAHTRDRAVLRHLSLHEMIHAATSAFGREVDRLASRLDPKFPGGITVRNAVIEGLTDLATILITKKQSPFDNYAPHRSVATQLIDMVGADTARRALFGGDKSAIKLVMDAAIQLAKQSSAA
jgi:hypothetical protein